MTVSSNPTWVILPVLMIIALVFSLTPFYTRKSEAFGVSIPVSAYDHPLLKALRRRYMATGLGIGAVFCILSVLMNPIALGKEWYIIVLVLMEPVCYFCLYLYFHKQAKQIKSAQNWAVQTTSTIAVDLSPSANKFISYNWLLIFPAIILITGFVGFKLYPNAPNPMPTHWDLFGNPDAWSEKSIGFVWFILLSQVLMSALMCFVLHITKTARRQLDADNIEESARRVDLFRRAWGGFTLFAGTIINLVFTLMMLGAMSAVDSGLMTILLFTGVGTILVYSLVLAFTVGQGGSRIKLQKEGKGLINIRDDDRYWKLGTFYYNPDDAALFVEKRFGIGWTCNFARPMSWVLMGGLIALIFGMVFLGNLLGA